jgi:hypothetical protein
VQIHAALLICVATICAGGVGTADEPADAPLVSDTWQAVNHITLFRKQKFTPLNDYLLIVATESKQYLLVFDEGCHGLGDQDIDLIVRHHGPTLHVRTDSIQAGMVSCISVAALKKRFTHGRRAD